METSEQIDCPAPLPEDPADALLTERRTPAPYEVSEKKIKKKATGTQKSSQRQVVSDSSSDNSETHSSRENEEKEDDSSPSQVGGDRKRMAAPTGEAGGSKKGRTLLPDCSTTAADGEDEWLLRASPWRSRKYSDTRVTHSILLLHCFS